MAEVSVLLLEDPSQMQLAEIQAQLEGQGIMVEFHFFHTHTFWKLTHEERLTQRGCIAECARARPENYQLVILGHGQGLGLRFGSRLPAELRPNTLVVADEPIPAGDVTAYDDLGFRHIGARTGRRLPQWIEERARLHMGSPVSAT